MRTLALRNTLAEQGACFENRCGIEIPSVISDLKKEYHIIRDGVGVTDFSFMQKFRIPADEGIDILDNIFAGNIARIRFCRVLHTFMADEQGQLMADCYIANNDEDFIVLCESIVDDDKVKEVFVKNGAQDCGLVDMTATHVALSIDGYKAWAVAKDLFGADVLGLPYLSIETYPFEGVDVSLIRAGKTSEFGYILLAPNDIAKKLLETLKELAQKYDGDLCGVKIHDELRLEGRFFNIFAEGVRVKDPLSLGLQWMIDFDKEMFVGRDAIMQKRSQGFKNKIIGIKADPSADGLEAGAALFCSQKQVGSVQATCFSHVLNSRLGLALLPVEMAYTGLTFNLGKPNGVTVETISMPPIVPKSLSVKLNEL